MSANDNAIRCPPCPTIPAPGAAGGAPRIVVHPDHSMGPVTAADVGVRFRSSRSLFATLTLGRPRCPIRRQNFDQCAAHVVVAFVAGG
ncbi:MAG: hypothetical protein LC808_09775 [Actinobacteria bacterium]|nr:hypothetical protein [Actinomycetota bacterium]